MILISRDYYASSREGTYGVRLFSETINENSKQFVSVVDSVRIFSNDPDERSFSLRLIEFVKIRTKNWDDALVCGWVFSENIL